MLLYEESKSDNLDFPYQEYATFSLLDLNGAECTANLRVKKHRITRPEDALQIPAIFKCDQGRVSDESEYNRRLASGRLEYICNKFTA